MAKRPEPAPLPPDAPARVDAPDGAVTTEWIGDAGPGRYVRPGAGADDLITRGLARPATPDDRRYAGAEA